MAKLNTCVFISGTGTNLKELLRRSSSYSFPINIKLIISNNKKAKGLTLAKKYAIPYLITKPGKKLAEENLLKEIKRRKISLILLAGYMKVLSKKFILSFGKSILNIHPSLLPKYKGLKTYERVIKAKEKKTGCTVHFVNDRLDAGKIILKKFFYINKSDNLNILRKKTQKLEYKAYSEAIIKIFRKN